MNFIDEIFGKSTPPPPLPYPPRPDQIDVVGSKEEEHHTGDCGEGQDCGEHFGQTYKGVKGDQGVKQEIIVKNGLFAYVNSPVRGKKERTIKWLSVP